MQLSKLCFPWTYCGNSLLILWSQRFSLLLHVWCTTRWLGCLGENAVVGMRPYFTCTFPCFLPCLNPQEVPVCSEIASLSMHFALMPMSCCLLLLCCIDWPWEQLYWVRAKMQLMQCPVPADHVWGGMYRSAFRNNAIIIPRGIIVARGITVPREYSPGILWDVCRHFLTLKYPLVSGMDFTTSIYLAVSWILVNGALSYGKKLD